MIVVPYTKLSEATRKAVPGAEFVRITDADGYRLLLADLWQQGDEFILVEHDVAPTIGQIVALESCHEPWCYYGYFPGHWIPVFGCVRFGREIIAGTQGVWDDESWPWNQLDAKFAGYARSLGWRHHWHSPHVAHEGTTIVGAAGAQTSSLPLWLSALTAEMELASLRETVGEL